MIRNDYIMRMIEQLSIAIAKIAGLKVNKKYEVGLQTASEAFKDIFGLSSETIDSLDYKSLIYLIGFNDVSGRAKCLIAADLLKEKADVYEALNKYDESYSCHLKSMNIFIEVFLADEDLTQEYINKIEELYSKINKYQIPRDSLFLLFKFFEDTGQYSKAEDILFEMLGDYSQDKNVVNDGIAFYLRLKEKGEAELIKGNLPMNEVIEGLNKLEIAGRISP